MHNNPNKKLSPRQRQLCVEIVGIANEARKLRVGYHRLSKDFFYIGKCNFKQQWLSLAFTSVPYMVMKIKGIPTVFDDSQLLADYHWHFNAYPMILSVYAIDNFLNFEYKRTHTHTHAHARALETIYSITFQLNGIF